MSVVENWMKELTRWEEFYGGFARHMKDEHGWDADDIIYFYEKPHKCNKEIEQFVNDGVVVLERKHPANWRIDFDE